MRNKEITNIKSGVLGAGQLGKMLSVAAAPWSIDIELMDHEKSALDKGVACNIHYGDVKDYDQVVEFGKDKDIVTVEKEDVNVDALQTLKESGVKVCPDPESLRIIQDKYKQKQFYKENDFNTPAFYNINKNDLIAKINANEQSLPFVLKFRTCGYDGKGVLIIRDVKELEPLDNIDYLVEDFIDIKKELSIIAARNGNGEVVLYDISEPVASDGFLMKSLKVPVEISEKLNENLQNVAKRLITAFKIEGLLAIEYIIDVDDNYYINEVSPRPHNTGHHTIEFNSVSQFELHWRAILNLPMVTTRSKNNAVCINVLGPENASGEPVYEGLEELLSEPDIYLHLYGKKNNKPNRKLGHITVIADNEEELQRKINIVENKFRVKA
jgi:5-(carboxyamino)imidazole ribonucleotide synthase